MKIYIRSASENNKVKKYLEDGIKEEVGAVKSCSAVGDGIYNIQVQMYLANMNQLSTLNFADAEVDPDTGWEDACETHINRIANFIDIFEQRLNHAFAPEDFGKMNSVNLTLNIRFSCKDGSTSASITSDNAETDTSINKGFKMRTIADTIIDEINGVIYQ